MQQIKNYNDMSAEQQAQWVSDFATLMEEHGENIITMAKQQRPGAAMPDKPLVDTTVIRQLFSLLAAWPFAQDFCMKAARYNDYMSRVSRLPIYIEKVKNQLADGLTTTDNQGRTVAYVSPSAPLRRRGRPTKEEVAARAKGMTVQVTAEGPENEKRRRIAALLGLEVVVAGEAPREKNNAELALDRQKKQEEYDRQNPSLFPSTAAPSKASAAQPQPSPENVPYAAIPSQPSMLMSDVYAERIEQDRFHLTDLAWLCSDSLKDRIEQVRALRTKAEAASERAKLLTEKNGSQKEISEYAQQAQQAVEEYTAIYAAVDDELAILFKRLTIDMPFVDRFKKRFKGVDIEKIQKITRPYYEKMKSPELDIRIKTLIEQDNPEYAEKLAQQEKDKAEAADIIRYIMRKDKAASDARVKTMTKRIARLRELRGDEVADSYLPVLEKTKADNALWRSQKKKK